MTVSLSSGGPDAGRFLAGIKHAVRILLAACLPDRRRIRKRQPGKQCQTPLTASRFQVQSTPPLPLTPAPFSPPPGHAPYPAVTGRGEERAAVRGTLAPLPPALNVLPFVGEQSADPWGHSFYGLAKVWQKRAQSRLQ